MPVNVVLIPISLTCLAVKIAEKPWSQIWPMDIRLRFPKAGKMLDWQAPRGSWGKGRRAVWDARIDDLLGRPTIMSLGV